MSFSSKTKTIVLIKSRRSCCICHKFAGLYTNVHHIKPKSKGGNDDLDNAIVLCLKCHGEVGHYNHKHPIGIKYSPEEVKQHRDNWWEWCKTNPFKPLPKYPISLSPTQLNFVPDGWNNHFVVGLTNTTNHYFYQICLKFTYESEEFDYSNILFTFPPLMNEQVVESNGHTYSLSILLMSGIDVNNKNATYIYIERLEPKNNYAIEVKNKGDLSKDKLHSVTCELINFSEAPRALVTKEVGKDKFLNLIEFELSEEVKLIKPPFPLMIQ